jgi:rhodanese-related sulfurtransferase
MKRLRNILWLPIAVALALSIGLGWAGTQTAAASEKADSGDDWKFHTIVDVDFVNQHVTIPPPEGVMIIDSRPFKPKYYKGHIPTAISIPDSQFDKMTDKLSQDKNTLLIFYCEGPTWKLSHKSARKAEELGYKNVKVFADGYPGWLKAGNYGSVSVEYVAEQIEANEMMLVDSRPKKPKYDKGYIPSAISLPDSEFDKLQGKLPRDENTPLIFYCEGFTWKLSHKSARKAVELGYKNVTVFAAGYPAWKEFAGDSATATAFQVKGGEEEGSIEIAAFEKILKEDPGSILLIDVRDPDDFKKGTFKTAINIPTDDLEKKLKTLPSDKPIVFVCNTGAKSGEAFYMMKDLRPELKEVYYLEAQVIYKKDGAYEIKKPK